MIAQLATARLGITLGLLIPASDPIQKYNVTVLPTLGGAANTPWAINNAGLVVGRAETAQGIEHAYAWLLGNIVDLGAAELDHQSGATAVNDRGVIVGWLDEGAATRAVIFDDGVIIDLGLSDAWAGDVNDAGTIVGWMQTAESAQHAFRWQDGHVTDLGSLGGPFSKAHALNSVNFIVGSAWNAANEPHAVLWRDDRIIDLGTLGGVWSVALFVADDGSVIGASETNEDVLHAFLWRARRGMLDLGTRSGCKESMARAMNRLGQIAGAAWSCDELGGAILWQDGEIIDLQELLPPESDLWLGQAVAINDAGQIAVVAYGPKAVLMTPAYLGDINEDGTIGILDLLQLLAHWGSCATICAADINHDGVVDHADLLLLLGNWSA